MNLTRYLVQDRSANPVI